ncbi:MAG: zf-HC2 domain-containing protein [Planctomycetota bacterium]
MRCEQAQEWISKKVDGVLAVKEVGQLRQHLEQCGECREFEEDMLAMKAWFPAEEAVAVPAGFAQRIAAMAFDGQAAAPILQHVSGGRPRAGSTPERFAMQLMALAAALLLALGLALYMQRGNSNHNLNADETQTLEQVLEELRELNQGAPAANQEAVPKSTDR